MQENREAGMEAGEVGVERGEKGEGEESGWENQKEWVSYTTNTSFCLMEKLIKMDYIDQNNMWITNPMRSIVCCLAAGLVRWRQGAHDFRALPVFADEWWSEGFTPLRSLRFGSTEWCDSRAKCGWNVKAPSESARSQWPNHTIMAFIGTLIHPLSASLKRSRCAERLRKRSARR